MTREEALNEIRSWAIPSEKGWEVLETLIPELAESEDEKMINELQGFLDSFGADYFGTGEWQKFHDWLEKQKESLHISETCKENPNSFTNEDERIRKELVAFFKEMRDTWHEIYWHDLQVEGILAWLEKQKYDRMQPIYDNQESFESALDKAWKSYNDSGARTVDGCEDNYIECAHAKGFREGYLFGLGKYKDLDKMIVVSPEVWDNAISDAYENGKKDEEKQKEQKPIEIDKEINRWMGCEAFPEGTNITTLPQAMEIVERTAKHFFELGEKTVPSPGGYWEGFNAGVRECQAKSRDAKGAMKEQEPELYYDKELDNAAREFYLSGGAVSPIDSTGLVPIVRMAEFGATWMKERMEKEQKPINLDLDTLVIELEETIGTSPHSRETIKEFFLKATQKYVNALRKTNKEIGELIEENFYLKEQQPAEWSDYKDKVNVPYCSSEPEWSEEDEKQIRQIERIVKNAGCTKMLQEKIHNWFESLRPQPHWKPSEEQMEALKNSAYGTYQNGDGPVLRGLYEQLEKLM